MPETILAIVLGVLGLTVIYRAIEWKRGKPQDGIGTAEIPFAAHGEKIFPWGTAVTKKVGDGIHIEITATDKKSLIKILKAAKISGLSVLEPKPQDASTSPTSFPKMPKDPFKVTDEEMERWIDFCTPLGIRRNDAIMAMTRANKDRRKQFIRKPKPRKKAKRHVTHP
jgi:hypothetical protein